MFITVQIAYVIARANTPRFLIPSISRAIKLPEHILVVLGFMYAILVGGI
jgi:hypothetical protein